MSLWFDKHSKRWRIRIRRSGREVARLLPQGITRAKAEELHRKLSAEIFEAADLGRERHTIADAMNRLIEHHLPQKTGHHVLSNIRALLPYIEGRTLEDISTAAQDYVSAERGRLTPATLNRRLAVLRRVSRLAWATWKWLDRPVSIPTLTENNARHYYLTRGELELLAFFAGAWCDPAGDMVLVAGYTGLRRGELLALEPRDIREGAVWVRQSKTGMPRAVPLVAAIEPVARRWTLTPKPHPRTLYGAFQQAARAIGRPEVTFHDLRHSCASLLVQAGVDLYTVGRILGHSDPRSTQRYAHLSLEQMRTAMGKIAPEQKTTG